MPFLVPFLSPIHRTVFSGIPTIRYTQHHRTSYIGNLSTVATFFSAVTATTLQISLGQQNPTSLGGTFPLYGCKWKSSHFCP
jgi:hypothetical protein